MASQSTTPTDISITGDKRICIAWSNGEQSFYSARELRGNCPCAQCVDENTGQRMVFPKDIPENTRPLEARPVGRYALQFIWSDGHDTGIYTFQYLREINQNG